MKHRHHIVPKHAGGTDEPSNLIELTVEEHAEAHRILFEKYGRKEDELAWKGLAGIICKAELLHELFVNAGKKSRPPIDHKPNLGRKWSKEYKEKMSVLLKGKSKSEIHKQKISKSKSQEWVVKTPEGEELKIKNLEQYCKEKNLKSSKIYLVASGKRNHHQGYICRKVG